VKNVATSEESVTIPINFNNAVTCMRDVDGVWIDEFIDHLQVTTTNNYNTISKLYSSPEHIVYCSKSVTRRFLVTAPIMTIPLLPAQVL
jgi:hypothetical protein